MSVIFTSTAGLILIAMLLIQAHQNSRTEHLFLHWEAACALCILSTKSNRYKIYHHIENIHWKFNSPSLTMVCKCPLKIQQSLTEKGMQTSTENSTVPHRKR